MDKYKSLYSDMKFERGDLFKLVRETYGSRKVLYPGCSIHITPSFYFPHVVFVDQSEAAAHFFAEEKALHEFVNRSKNYKQSAYFRFIHQDYSTPLPFEDGSFDLLLSLFAGGVSTACVRYLRAGGMLVTNNHLGDAADAARDDRLELKATIRFHKERYQLEERSLEERKVTARKLSRRYLKQTSRGLIYRENEIYHIFRRTH